MITAPFPALKTFYLTGQPLYLPQVPAGTEVVVARSAFGQTVSASARDGQASLPGLPRGTHAVEARAAGGHLLGEEFTTVAATPGERPVLGFATSFSLDAVPEVLGWLRALCAARPCSFTTGGRCCGRRVPVAGNAKGYGGAAAPG
jgi:hypothetical protein